MRKLLVLLLSGTGNVGIILLKIVQSIIGPFCGTMNCRLLLILKTLFGILIPLRYNCKTRKKERIDKLYGYGSYDGRNGVHWHDFWIIILGLLFYGVYILIAKASEKPKGVRSDDSLQILKERLAQGEINEDEYEKLKKVLKKIRDTLNERGNKR